MVTASTCGKPPAIVSRIGSGLRWLALIGWPGSCQVAWTW
jgi:hypothetical protein